MLNYVRGRLPKKRPELQSIAVAVNMTASGLEKIARGYTKQPRIETLHRLYKHLRATEQPAAPETPEAA